jgi:predicted PurR-regulated permease PerM
MGPIPKERDAYIAAAFALIFILILCALSFVIARPFLAALLWGIILAVATWPIFPGSAGSSEAGIRLRPG